MNNQGKERLDTLVQGQQDHALLKVVDYLKNLEEDDIFLNEEKDLKGMCNYVKSKAKELAVNNMAFVEDETVYEWALTYWQLSNEELGIKKEEPKPIVQKVDNVVKEQEVPQQEQLSLLF